MCKFWKLFVCGCSLSLTTQNSRAQTTVGPTIPYRTYSGNAVQYTAAGQVTNGIINVEIDSENRVGVQITLNGVTTNYFGALGLAADGTRRPTGTASISAVDAPNQPLADSCKIPLFVKKQLVYGGTLGEDGTSLTFRANKGALVITN